MLIAVLKCSGLEPVQRKKIPEQMEDILSS